MSYMTKMPQDGVLLHDKEWWQTFLCFRNFYLWHPMLLISDFVAQLCLFNVWIMVCDDFVWMISNVLSRFHHLSFILSLQWRVPGSAQSSVSKSPRFHTGGGLQSGGHDLSRLWPCCRSVCALNTRIFTSLFLSEQGYLFIESSSGG